MSILQPLSSEIDNSQTLIETNPIINFVLPSGKEDIPKYLFRYMSLQSFMSMFFLKQILFRSAVTQKDKNECTYPYKNLFYGIGAPQSLHDYYSLISRERGRFFISCWFGSKDPYPKETMRSYFSKDGVIVAFDGEKLVDAFKSDINLLHTKTNINPLYETSHDNYKLYAHGHVSYYTKNEVIKDINNGAEISHPAFAKTKEFELENEYRFVVDIDKKLLEFNFLNKIHSTGKSLRKDFDGVYQSVFARLVNNKSFNDIGLIRVIACSDQTMSSLMTFSNLREAKFSQLTAKDEEYNFTQTANEAIKIIDWDKAVNEGVAK